MSITLEIAKRANGLRYEQFSQEAIHWAKVSIQDVVGVSLAGAVEAPAKIAVEVLDAAHVPGPCLVMGRHLRTRPIDAALINAVTAHALDFDDGYQGAGHLCVVLFPATLAVAERQGASGKEFIEAFMAGYETAVHMGLGLNAVNFHHYEKGWHPTATVGTFGAAAACGRLLRLDDAQFATAISICASLASGVKSNFGTMTKPLHAGLAARNGLFAALLAQGGFTAAPDALEHPQGFFEVFNGPGAYDTQPILGDWTATWHIAHPGSCFKQYPCVYSAHPSIAAAIRLRETHKLRTDQIKKVTICLHPRKLLSHTQHAATSGMDAKFSLRYLVARSLVDGSVLLEHFEDDAHRDPTVTDLMNKIETVAVKSDDAFAGHVAVTLNDGTEFKETLTAIPGLGSQNPLSPEVMEQKFRDCASRLLSPDHIAPLYAAIWDLENMAAIQELSTLLENGLPR